MISKKVENTMTPPKSSSCVSPNDIRTGGKQVHNDNRSE